MPQPSARALDRGQQLGEPVGQGPFGELDHASHAPAKLGKGTEAGVVGLGVHEQRQRRLHGMHTCAGDRGELTDLVELRQATLHPSGPEQPVGTF